MKEKTYTVEVYRSYKHGIAGANYKGLAVLTITATSKKEAKEKALNSFIGQPIAEYEHFPIDAEHAPEYKWDEERKCWSGSCSEIEKHIINEYDVAMKNVFAIDVTLVQ